MAKARSARARAPRMSPAERKAQLLDVSEALFVSKGYAATSMEDICRAAGVSRPVVYEHLRTKEGAYLACVERARATYEADLLKGFDPEAPPREQLRAGADAFFRFLEEDPDRWALLFGSNNILPGEKSEELAALRFGTIEKLRVLLAHAAPDAPADRVEACAHIASGAGERLGHWWLTRPDLRREQIAAHYVEILWEGLRPYVEESGGR
jgi:AcrR family transcriptional regulator